MVQKSGKCSEVWRSAKRPLHFLIVRKIRQRVGVARVRESNKVITDNGAKKKAAHIDRLLCFKSLSN